MKYIWIVTALMIAIGCSKDEPSFAPLEGYHSLSAIGCYCPAIELTPHQQQWSFDFVNLEIAVKTFGNVGEEGWPGAILEDGLYPFGLQEGQVAISGDTVDILTLEGRQYGLSQRDNTIRLDSGSPFGIIDSDIYVFTRN